MLPPYLLDMILVMIFLAVKPTFTSESIACVVNLNIHQSPRALEAINNRNGSIVHPCRISMDKVAKGTVVDFDYCWRRNPVSRHYFVESRLTLFKVLLRRSQLHEKTASETHNTPQWHTQSTKPTFEGNEAYLYNEIEHACYASNTLHERL